MISCGSIFALKEVEWKPPSNPGCDHLIGPCHGWHKVM